MKFEKDEKMTWVVIMVLAVIINIVLYFKYRKDEVKHVPVEIKKAVYHYEEPKDWVNDSTVCVERRWVYDHLEKQD